MKRKLPFISILFALMAAFCFPAESQAQTITTQGTEFWFAFMENFDRNANNELLVFISSNTAAAGIIEIPGTGWTQNFNVAANGAVTINIPLNDGYTEDEGFHSSAIHIVSDNPVNVFTINYRNQSTDGSLILPIDALGSRYYTAAYIPMPQLESEILIVGITDNTRIDIIPPGQAATTITLDRGQVYQFQSTDDLTGTLITSDAHGGLPFAALTGTRCSQVPSGTHACDHLVEQIQPVRAWRRTFVIPPLATRNGDTYRVIASRNSTQVIINGAVAATLNAGRFYETILTQPSVITSNRAISVVQYSNGQEYDNTSADPFMIVLSPIEQTREDITFYVYNFPTISNNYLNIVTRTGCAGTMMLDGVDISAQFSALPTNAQYSYAQVPVTEGTHRLVSGNDCGFNAYVYGFGDYDSYGYSAGMSLDTLSITARNDANCAGEVVNFLVTSNPYPIINYLWSFGDGQSSAQATPQHVYDNGGNYQVTLVVTYDNNEKDTVIQNFTITEVDASIDYAAGGCAAFEATFTDRSVVTGGQIASRLWDFGDGQTSNLANPVHTYSGPGNYQVILTANSENGCVDRDTVEFDIYPLPIAALDYQAGGCGIFDAQFNDRSTVSSGNITEWAWDFGDGQSSDQQNAVHSYTLPGHYIVTLVVTTDGGCMDTTTVEFDIFPLPEPVISPLGPTWFCSCDSVQLDAGNKGYISYQWSTGEATRFITVRNPGDYTVTITDTNGCSNSSPPVSIEVTYPQAIISLPPDTVKSETGRDVNIPVYIAGSEYLDTCGVTNFRMRIRLNRSVLVPDNPGDRGVIQGNDRMLTIDGSRTRGDSLLAMLHFISTLGNTPETPVTIESFEWTDCPFDVQINNGAFALTNICRSGGIQRLFMDNSAALLVTPNPASGSAVIWFNAGGRHPAEIYMTDIFGNKVLQLFKGESVEGVNNVEAELEGLASGTYLVVLKTPYIIATQLTEVRK